MGVSTDGIIFYGFEFRGEVEDPQEVEFEDWEDFYCEKIGLVDDSGLFNKDGEYAESRRENKLFIQQVVTTDLLEYSYCPENNTTILH